jgi:ribonuclease-3
MRPNSSHTGKRRRNRTRGQVEAPRLDAADRDACEEVIGHRFRSPELLDRAMTHRSAVQGRPSEWSNERLEFLGDRVLGLVMAETLLERFPGVREGELAPRLNLVVSREACARIGAEIGLGVFLIVDEAERSTGGATKKSLLANVVEAAIGAVYLDAGLPAAKTFILRRWKQALMDVSSAPRDPKTALQEWAQGQGHPTPRYQHDGREGPDHAPVFTASVRVEGVPEVSGSGASKQEAERAAARAMLERIGLRNS